jgi:CheY-like chemotaxis protein
MPKTRLLFVDDEPTIRLTLSAILAGEGFQVTVASTVPEALALITAEKYDVLLSDLNIGQLSDGFTVVSAMRRVQPDAITLILTGYPAFETALRAIREQVDDFFTKPTDVKELVTAIKSKLEIRKGADTKPVPLRRLTEIIAESESTIISEWLRDAERDPQISALHLTREERIDHLPQLLKALVQPRKSTEWKAEPNLMHAAALHGVTRKRQGYSLPLMLEESRILNSVIFDHVRRNLLTVDFSFLLTDLIEVADKIHYLSQHAVRGYLRDH